MKLYTSLLIVAVIFFNNHYVDLNKNVKIYSGEDNIEFFEIDDYEMTKEFLKSSEFTEMVYDNIEKNMKLNLGYEEIIVVNKFVDEIKYRPYQVYLSDDNEEVEKISSYYGIIDKSENKTKDNFYLENFTIENDGETHFVDGFNSKVALSSHSTNVKIYFARINNKYLVFSINQN